MQARFAASVESCKMPEKRHTSNAGSAVSVFKAGGELVAVTYPIEKTGYKAKGAYGSRPVFNSESTNTFYQKHVLATGEGKKLEAYRPLAPRNRPKHLFDNIVGTRHKLHPCIQHETHRGSSQVKLTDGHVDSKKPWKTTNQVFNECTQAREAIGMGNQGISSDMACYFHKKQELYRKL